MSKVDLRATVTSFFRGIASEDIVVFTTFGLDERLLVSLLQAARVSEGNRIVVFHELMNHRFPGYLRHHYRNSLVVSVRLSEATTNHKCPVFHSKIWMVVSGSKRPICKRLAVLSGNLTNYHMRKEISGTFETLVTWHDLRLPLRKLPFLKRVVLRRGQFKPTLQIKLKPGTIVVDATKKYPKVRYSPKCAIEEIEDFFHKQKKDNVMLLAAPFIGRKAVKQLTQNQHDRPEIRRGESARTRQSLHAKIIMGTRYLIAGSANLTAQALGIGHGRPINHETILLAKNQKRYDLKAALRRFPKVKFRELKDKDDLLPCDPDPDYPYDDWIEKKRKAIRSPSEVVIKLTRDAKTATITVKGGWRGATRIELCPGRDTFNPARMSVNKSEAKKGLRDQKKLWEILMETPVLVVGKRRGKTLWEKELDYGVLWYLLDRILHLNGRRVTSEVTDGHDDESSSAIGSNSISEMDVRDARRTLFESYRNKQRTPGENQAFEWFTNINPSFPHWSSEVAHRLSEQIK